MICDYTWLQSRDYATREDSRGDVDSIAFNDKCDSPISFVSSDLEIEEN